MLIEWSSRIKNNFKRFDDFSSPINCHAAFRAAQQIRRPTNILLENPDIGTVLDDGADVRELFIDFGKSGYVVHYEADYDAKIVRKLKGLARQRR